VEPSTTASWVRAANAGSDRLLRAVEREEASSPAEPSEREWRSARGRLHVVPPLPIDHDPPPPTPVLASGSRRQVESQHDEALGPATANADDAVASRSGFAGPGDRPPGR
jgi:hypothetical protein